MEKIILEKSDGWYKNPTTIRKKGTCGECGIKGVPVINIIALHDVEQIIHVEICRGCLLKYANMLANPDKVRGKWIEIYKW